MPKSNKSKKSSKPALSVTKEKKNKKSKIAGKSSDPLISTVESTPVDMV